MQPETSDGEPALRNYLTGFSLALVLTIIPFGLVAVGALPRLPMLIVIFIAAIIQILVHLRYFLHFDLSTTPRENILAIAFTVVLILIMIGGSLWIMFDLNQRMMPL